MKIINVKQKLMAWHFNPGRISPKRLPLRKILLGWKHQATNLSLHLYYRFFWSVSSLQELLYYWFNTKCWQSLAQTKAVKPCCSNCESDVSAGLSDMACEPAATFGPSQNLWVRVPVSVEMASPFSTHQPICELGQSWPSVFPKFILWGGGGWHPGTLWGKNH